MINRAKSLIRKYVRHYRAWKIKRIVAECGPGLFVGGRCRMTVTTYLGENVNMNGLEVLGGGKCTIGDNLHSGRGCLIITQNHKYRDGNAVPYDTKEYDIRDVRIGHNVWLGERVIVLPGVNIADGAIIQAGSVVVSNIPSCAIAGGAPARVFSSRDEEHYNRCVREQRYC